MTSPLLSIIVPGFNERQSIAGVVAEYRAALAPSAIPYELILVNDASTDGMGQLADELAAGDPHVRVLHHEQNLGQVEGILSGFRAAQGQILAHNAMDLTLDPAHTLSSVQPILDGAADVVVVERRDRKGYGSIRTLMSVTHVALVRLLLGSPFHDHNFVQFYRREVFERLPIVSRGVSTVTTELILRARRCGYRVVRVEQPYQARRQGRSTITPRKVVRTAGELFKLSWRLCREPSPAPVKSLPRVDAGGAPS